MSNGTYSASSRDATAKEVGQILDQVLNSANSKFGAKYVFSGFRVDSPAFARDGVYLGDDGAIFLQVGRKSSIASISLVESFLRFPKKSK